MSRTYRRRAGDIEWHRRDLRKEWWIEYLYPGLPNEVGKKRADARFHSDNLRAMSTPSWWVREYMTAPQRQEVRRLVRKVLLMSDLEDTPLFPLAKKPHLYYW